MLDRLISWIPTPKKSPGELPDIHLDINRVASSPLFDEAFYLRQLNAQEPIRGYPPEHYVRGGYRKFDPHPQFQSNFFRAEVGGLPDEVCPLLRYLDGGSECRYRPNPDFDPDAFLSAHPEAVESGLTPLEYQLRHGEAPPSVLLVPVRGQFSFDQGRFLYLLAKDFHEAGCRVFVQVPSDVVGNSKLCPCYDTLLGSPWAIQSPYVREAPPDAVVLTDCPQRAAKAERSILWSRGPIEPGGYLYRIPMHVRQQEFGKHRHLRWLRGQKRTTSVFYSGAGMARYYFPYFQLKYRQPGRLESIKLVQRHFADKLDTSLQTNYRLNKRPEGAPPIVLADQREVRSPAVRWLEQLACADFFLALPGGYYPPTHTMVEGMSVGAIPILSYPDYYHPALEDGVHCLTYRDKRSLVAAVERALAMPEEEKARLRRNVTDYYDRFFAPGVAARALLDGPEPHKRLYFPYERRLKPGWAVGLKG